METNERTERAYWALRITFGLVPFLAGLDKFLNILTQWDMYLSPLAQKLLPVSGGTFMQVSGVIEMLVGIAILTRWTRWGSYIAAAWLVGIAANLLLAGFYDVAVRDVVMAVSAFTLAQLAEARAEDEVPTMRSLRESSLA